MPDDKFSDASQNPPVDGVPPQAAAGDRKPNGEAPEEPVPDVSAKPASRKGAKAKAYKPSSDTEPETTFERAESLPDEAQAAPEPPPLQEAADLDELLSSAIAPDDEDVDLAEAELGPPSYVTVLRRTSPPQMIPIRIFPKSVGVATVYMLSLKREAQDDGDLDTIP